jgi:general secretion pathway protein A
MGFRKTPFTREFVVRERYAFPHHDEAVRGLFQAVHKRMSAALISPAGTGKTVVLRVLQAELPDARYNVRYVKVTGLSKRDLCREISAACGVCEAGIYPTLVRRLQDAFLQTTSTDGMRTVIILDEAHDLRPESLAMLRLLTNFEMDSRLVISLVLAGQPPLKALLARPEQEAVAQRLAHCATLRLLSSQETRDYMAHRCALAGAASAPFDDDAHCAIFEMTRGNMRAIDRLALKAIEIAAGAGAQAASAACVLRARELLPW